MRLVAIEPLVIKVAPTRIGMLIDYYAEPFFLTGVFSRDSYSWITLPIKNAHDPQKVEHDA
jgi:hypothetical protein